MPPASKGGRLPPDNKARPIAGPGKYAQRTDLSQPAPPQGRYVPGGLPYGDRQRLEQAQQIAPAPARRAQPQAPARGQVPPQIPSLAQILARPTERPTEPPTAGLPGGPGPGPEILPAELRAPAPSVSAILQQAAAKTGNSTILELAQRAAAAGQ